jgi:vancomycin resistance protein YoaR
MEEQTTETSADAPRSPSGEAEAPSAAADGTSSDDGNRPRRRWVLPALIAPIVLLVVLVIGWAVDTSAGGVARNVRLSGRDVGHLSEAELATKVEALAGDYAKVPVEIVARPGSTGGDTKTYRTTAGELGLMIDADATVQKALEVGDDAFVLLRPFAWARSFVSRREAPVVFQVSKDQVATAVVALEGDDRTPAAEPTVELVDDKFKVVPGVPGAGLDPARVAAALPGAATARGAGDGPVRVVVDRGAIAPIGGDAAAEEAAAGVESLVGQPVEIQTSAGNRTVAPSQLRTWVTLSTAPDGKVAVDLDPTRVAEGLRSLFKDIAGGPVDAHFTVEGGKPVIVPEQAGKVCCGEGAAATIIGALRGGAHSVALDLVDGAPAFTSAEAAKLGIIEEVGQPTVFGPTTKHACCEPRVQNIHRIADLVRGQVIRPGDTFSINALIGPRTRAKGFTEAGAIIDGEHGTAIGGGISQFATTLFNASLFSGLDFGEYQSHSLYFTRYPRGHEATLSYPHPDLKVKNTTPYGVLIWPEYTGTTLTVHLYSTHYVDVALGEVTTSPAGACTKYTTPRTRTYLDGRVVHDSVFARYRPAEGVDC